jgi:ferredoxin--NADP+ reductase
MTALLLPPLPSTTGIAEHDDRYNARLVRRVDDTDTLARFWIEADEPIAFQAGQYVTIGVIADGRLVQRPYSVASAPEVVRTEGYELYIRLVDGGAFTPLLWRLPVGHRLRLTGPKGRFTFDPDDRRVHLLVSTGTGCAPFLSLMRSRLLTGPTPPSVFVTGNSYVDDIGYRSLLEGWERTGDYPVTFVPTISRPHHPANAGWTGRTGRAEAVVAGVCDELDLPPEDTVAYVCGNPDMILAVEAELLRLGWDPAQVHKELYWPKGKGPTALPRP